MQLRIELGDDALRKEGFAAVLSDFIACAIDGAALSADNYEELRDDA